VWQVLKNHPLVNDVVADGDSLHVVVKEGREALPKLLPALDAAHAGIRSITLSRPSLDDVFLKHTGKAFSSETTASGGEAWWAKWQKGGGSWGNKQWSEASTEETRPVDTKRPAEGGAASGAANESGSGAPAWKQWSGDSGASGQVTWNGNGQSPGSGSESWPQQTWDKDKGR
jgi:hypothetical protein